VTLETGHNEFMFPLQVFADAATLTQLAEVEIRHNDTDDDTV